MQHKLSHFTPEQPQGRYFYLPFACDGTESSEVTGDFADSPACPLLLLSCLLTHFTESVHEGFSQACPPQDIGIRVHSTAKESQNQKEGNDHLRQAAHLSLQLQSITLVSKVSSRAKNCVSVVGTCGPKARVPPHT